MNIDFLPKVITCKNGLRHKLDELNREAPMRLRADGLQLEYNKGVGVVLNRRSGEIYGKYTQFKNDTYKLTKGGK